jgi:hypothetical protein
MLFGVALPCEITSTDQGPSTSKFSLIGDGWLIKIYEQGKDRNVLLSKRPHYRRLVPRRY